jgi:hypothetical protein
MGSRPFRRNTVMPVQSLGRNTTTDLYKAGERCHLTGSYYCENCRRATRETVIQMEGNAIFPLCEHCADLDMGWRLGTPPRD